MKYLLRVIPVKLAYSSYESTDVDVINNNKKCPVVIMHGLLGSKNNWNSLSKSIHSRTKKKVNAINNFPIIFRINLKGMLMCGVLLAGDCCGCSKSR